MRDEEFIKKYEELLDKGITKLKELNLYNDRWYEDLLKF